MKYEVFDIEDMIVIKYDGITNGFHTRRNKKDEHQIVIFCVLVNCIDMDEDSNEITRGAYYDQGSGSGPVNATYK